MSVEVLDSQLPKHWTLCQEIGDSVILRLTEWAEGLYRAVKFAKMIIGTSISSQILTDRSKVSLIHLGQILRELVTPQNVKHLRRVQLNQSIKCPVNRYLNISYFDKIINIKV